MKTNMKKIWNWLKEPITVPQGWLAAVTTVFLLDVLF